MKKTKNRLMLSCLSLTSVLIFAACSSESGGGEGGGNTGGAADEGGEEADVQEGQTELRVSWWGGQERHNRTIEAIELFEEKNPDIAVSTEFSGWDSHWERLSTQAAGRNLPDVVQMDLQYLNEYVSRDLLVDLNEYVDSGTINFDNVDEALIEGGIVDDSLYAVNLGTNSLFVLYDPAIFEEAGVPVPEPGYTWEEYADTARALYDELGVYSGEFSIMPFFSHYLRQHDLWLYNEDYTEMGYDDQYLIDFLDMYKELLDDGVVPGPDVTTDIHGLEDQLIIHGDSATLPENSNLIIAYVLAADRPLEMTTFPVVEGGSNGHILKPGQFLSISSQSENQDEAARFIDFVTNDLEANEILNAERGVPISSEVRDHIYEDLDEVEQMQFDYMDLVEDYAAPIHPPEPPGTRQIGEAYTRLLEELSYDMITTEEFAERFREEAEGILNN
ncbi:ABC transporter substrate-binding protein [Alkalicoccobacillus porphyridii]|uniref:Sugar ABC transporter substrate-binding protein n=1 Tax=Alkalicoccobacillus porphyridii TaxID=2597270 RepID=A0A554A2H2_9BACI|nr:sugar ABC transporter substrate-binding protein [Alkalicoccobacillus porphyridii]TSB47891.1 sugar ABC transporter substrate-binding protein [Alkalicoccobacillus porphyridii]